MFILYTFNGGEWAEFASFKDRRDYRALVEKAAENKQKEGKTEEVKNAAALMRTFVLDGKAFSISEKKSVSRALRHFDEVGLSNDIFDVLEEMDGSAEKFVLLKEGEPLP